MRVRRSLVALALAPLLLAGCQEAEPTPKMPEPTASSSTPTATPTAEEESAEDFIRRWQAAGDALQLTGDTAEYTAMSPNCQACRGFVKRVEQVYGAGGHAEFRGATITRLMRVEREPPTFDVSKSVPQTVIHHGDGRVEKFPAGNTTIRVTLGRLRGDWVVIHFGVL